MAIADNALRHAEGINGHWLVDLWNGCARLQATQQLRSFVGVLLALDCADEPALPPRSLMCLPCAQCRQAREVDMHEE